MMTTTTKTEKTIDDSDTVVESLISTFESVSGEVLWKNSQAALGATINSLILESMNQEDPMSFMIRIAAKLQTEFTEK